jgi:hypothetical protein
VDPKPLDRRPRRACTRSRRPLVHPPTGDDRRIDRHGARAIQWELFGPGPQVRRGPGLECMGDEAVGEAVLSRSTGRRSSTGWRPTRCPSPPARLGGQAPAHRGLPDRHGCGWDDHRLAALDLQYHDLRPTRSLFARLDTERLVDEESVVAAVTEPPRGTRAWFRGKCLEKWPSLGGDRQLGLPRLRPRRRPAPARPYDGPLEGNGRPCGAAVGRMREPVRTVGPAERLGRVGDG